MIAAAVIAGEALCTAGAVVCAVLCVRNAHRAERAAKRAQDARDRMAELDRRRPR